MSWAGKKKAFYLSIVFGVCLIIIVPLVYVLYPEASCSDQKLNQGERGVDCEGPCPKICMEFVDPLTVSWARVFTVAPNVYSAAAYVHNSNVNLGARNVPYVFKFYDEKNILVGERAGTISVLPNSSFPVFEGVVTNNNRVPVRVFFEFTEVPRFERIVNASSLKVKAVELRDENQSSKLEATIVNGGVAAERDVNVIAVLYDTNGTAIAASQTILDNIPASGETKAFFTWSDVLTESVGVKEIYPLPKLSP